VCIPTVDEERERGGACSLGLDSFLPEGGKNGPREFTENKLHDQILTSKYLTMIIMRSLLILGLMVVVSSCVHTKSIDYSSVRRIPKAENFAIEILDPQSIRRHYKVIGTVQVDAGARFNIKDPIEELRKRARQMGADALLEPQQTPIGVGLANSNVGIFNGHMRDLFICKAIIWTD
jgi:hypothetical protein